MSLDARITPFRDGIASLALEGLVKAEVYVEAKALVCRLPAAAIRRTPEGDAEQMDQLLFGETFDVIEEEGAFLWGQARRDGYMGFVEAASLAASDLVPTHRVSALRTYAFANPTIKSRAMGPFSLNSLVTVEAEEKRLRKIAGSGWVAAEHLVPISEVEEDFVAVAERFLGTPYLWGGRESLGVDCSGLVQQALFACGQACPRDSDQQQAMGQPVEAADFGRGDLVFWPGHVAIGLEAGNILHANAYHMATAVEPLAEAITRIEATGYGPPTAYRRLG